MSIDIHALSGAYAVDALDGTERAEFERHLAECSSCQREVDDLREAAAAMSDVAEMAPPAGLRKAVLAGIAEVRPLPPVVGKPQVGRGRRWWAAGSLAIAASFGTMVVVAHPWTPTSVTVSEASQVMSAPDVITRQSSLAGGGQVTWYRSSSVGKAVVTGRDLGPLAASKVYELWLQRADGSMAPAGLLSPGTSTLVLNGSAATARGAGLTVEPAGGSAQPTSTPLALVSFG